MSVTGGGGLRCVGIIGPLTQAGSGYGVHSNSMSVGCLHGGGGGVTVHV